LLQAADEGFQERVKELGMQKTLTVAAMNMVLAEGALEKAATLEGKVLEAEARMKLALNELAVAEVEPEAVAAKLAQAEVAEASPRMTSHLPTLEEERPVLSNPPAGVAAEESLWQDFVRYCDERIAKLKAQEALPPPLRWAEYQSFRTRFANAMKYQHEFVEQLRADAALPRSQRKLLKDFERPIILENVGVSKNPKLPTRYADVLVFESAPGQPFRLHSFSVKQRALLQADAQSLQSVFEMDSAEAHAHYGGILEIRRRATPWFEKKLRVDKLSLVYDAKSGPKPKPLQEALSNLRKGKFQIGVMFQ